MDSFLLTFQNVVGTELNVTGVFTGEIVAISVLDPATGLPTGEVLQDEVDVLFSIRGADVAPLILGLTASILSVNGTTVASEFFLGDSSVNDAQDVLLMLSEDQVNAAAALQIAQLTDGDVAAATAALNAANAAAQAANTAAAVAAELALTPSATFLGEAADLAPVNAVNASRPGLARFDVTIPNLDLDLFANTGFGLVVGPEDEILIDRVSLMFVDSATQAVAGVFLPEIVSIVDPVSLAVDQGAVNVLFSIRGADVAPLVSGLSRAVLTLDLSLIHI